MADITRLRISDSGTHFVDQNGKPFFWMADTAWNGALKVTPEEWDQYLAARARQGFTVIQFVLTHWRGCMRPLHGRIYDELDGAVVEDPAALEAMDRYIARIVEHGMVPAPVMFWTNNPHTGDGTPFGRNSSVNPLFSEAAMLEIGRRMTRRWSRHNPLWILAGDGNYTPCGFAELWRRLGRGIFGDQPEALVTMHPCGCTWVGDLFAGEPWYRLAGIQSGHGDSEHDTRWHLSGPYTTRWSELKRPFIDLEPNYEAAIGYHKQTVYTDFHVRRGSCWALLGAPTAGVTYGITGVWAWLRETGEVAEGHGNSWTGEPWPVCLDYPGIESLRHIKAAFESLPWTELRPADHILAEQPGFGDADRTIKAAMTRDQSCTVVYMPVGGNLVLQHPSIRDGQPGQWVDLRTGDRHPLRTALSPFGQVVAQAPDARDWLLVL